MPVPAFDEAGRDSFYETLARLAALLAALLLIAALREPKPAGHIVGPNRELIAKMLERDANG